MRHRFLRRATEGAIRLGAVPRSGARIAARAGALLLAGAALAASDPGPPRAPRMQFVPPPAGSYSLQHIQTCPDGVLLDAAGRERRLSTLTHGQITLLTFFYTSCPDPLGCPFAFGLMNSLRQRIAADASLAGGVRFVSISFDPSHDSPQQLRSYARGVAAGTGVEWDFLTAPSMAQLLPLLQDFGQDVRVQADRQGRALRAISHMLKLFLIDAGGTVREIYALDYLQPEVMLNDIRTLRMEQPQPHRQAHAASAAAATAAGPGGGRSPDPHSTF